MYDVVLVCKVSHKSGCPFVVMFVSCGDCGCVAGVRETGCGGHGGSTAEWVRVVVVVFRWMVMDGYDGGQVIEVQQDDVDYGMVVQ
ncbi:hypothetical protein Tco_1319928 [Tanacetum coccineum]